VINSNTANGSRKKRVENGPLDLAIWVINELDNTHTVVGGCMCDWNGLKKAENQASRYDY